VSVVGWIVSLVGIALVLTGIFSLYGVSTALVLNGYTHP
jgi:hypothetical protein